MSANEADWQNEIRAEEGYNEKINEIIDVISANDPGRHELNLDTWKNRHPYTYEHYRIKAIKVYLIIRNGERKP